MSDLLSEMMQRCRVALDRHIHPTSAEGRVQLFSEVLFDLTPVLRDLCETIEIKDSALRAAVDQIDIHMAEIDRLEAALPARIVQLLMTPQDATWQSRLIGLGSDGVTYDLDPKGRWEPFVPPLGWAENAALRGPSGTGGEKD